MRRPPVSPQEAQISLLECRGDVTSGNGADDGKHLTRPHIDAVPPFDCISDRSFYHSLEAEGPSPGRLGSQNFGRFEK